MVCIQTYEGAIWGDFTNTGRFVYAGDRLDGEAYASSISRWWQRAYPLRDMPCRPFTQLGMVDSRTPLMFPIIMDK